MFNNKNCKRESDKKSSKHKEFDIWVDAPMTSTSNTWKTPEKSSLSPNSTLERSPRTSTPVPDILQNISDTHDYYSGSQRAYLAWKDNLQIKPKNMKTRGVFPSEEFVSGHFVMKEHEKIEYINENWYMPVLNRCFANLLINGPSPLVCQAEDNAGKQSHKMSTCFCLPNCYCTKYFAQTPELPIGYKYDSEGCVVSVVPSVKDPANIRIYFD